MADNYAVEQIASLPFGHLIGAPMTAAIEAQAAAAKATVDFISEVGFVPSDPDDDPLFPTTGPAGDMGEVRMITFTYESAGDASSSASLTVPLLTVVPIPYLGIDQLTIDFVAKISEAVTAQRKNASSSVVRGSANAKIGWGPVSAGLKGSYSRKHASTSSRTSKYQTELTMNVQVTASSSDMPGGMARVLDILQDLITNPA